MPTGIEPTHLNIITVLGVVLTFLFSILSFIVKGIYTAVRTMPEKYILKDDYHRDLDRFEHKLDRILDKLDGKADK